MSSFSSDSPTRSRAASRRTVDVTSGGLGHAKPAEQRALYSRLDLMR